MKYIMNIFGIVHYMYKCCCLLKGNSKQCNMAASTEVPTAAPVGGAIRSASTKEYLTDEEFFCDESQPPMVWINHSVCLLCVSSTLCLSELSTNGCREYSGWG